MIFRKREFYAPTYFKDCIKNPNEYMQCALGSNFISRHSDHKDVVCSDSEMGDPVCLYLWSRGPLPTNDQMTLMTESLGLPQNGTDSDRFGKFQQCVCRCTGARWHRCTSRHTVDFLRDILFVKINIWNANHVRATAPILDCGQFLKQSKFYEVENRPPLMGL